MKKYASKLAGFSIGTALNIRLSAWLAACIAAPCMLMAIPAVGASFDCSKGGSANEKIICQDPELSAMDDKLGKTFKLARKKAADRRAFNAASDKLWRWREQHCSTRECLVDWYRQRQQGLEAALSGTAATTAGDDKQAAAVAMAAAVAAPPKVPASKPAKPSPASTKPALAAAPVAPPKAIQASIPAAAPAPRVTVAAKPATSLQLQLTPAQIAGIAPEGASARAHYLSANKGEYIYADPDAKGDTPATVSVRYLGTDHGQHIIETKRKDVYTRYTCSADCALIGKLQLPGDAESDMVILNNDHKSLPSQIVTDALNGLLLESVVVR